ncbi:hypothetical protein [Bordetella trematum]|uniref:hypothetical protein n=1 Tax=Bordetella trematum TaxID=123899 RepID=UPI003AF33BB3
MDTFRSLGSGEGMSDVSAEIWRSVLTNFAIVAAITLLAWAVLRWLAGFYYARVDRRLADGPAGNDPHRPLRYRNATAIGATLLLDLAGGGPGDAGGLYRQPLAGRPAGQHRHAGGCLPEDLPRHRGGQDAGAHGLRHPLSASAAGGHA